MIYKNKIKKYLSGLSIEYKISDKKLRKLMNAHFIIYEIATKYDMLGHELAQNIYELLCMSDDEYEEYLRISFLKGKI